MDRNSRRQCRIICMRCGTRSVELAGSKWFLSHLQSEHGVRPVAPIDKARIRFKRRLELLEEAARERAA